MVETGGGASSNTVISPQIHRDFCLPYDRKLHEAIHQAGHKVVYHTCGGMTKILDLIVANGCDASETLSPRAIGGDITDPAVVKRAIGARVCLIGGMDHKSLTRRARTWSQSCREPMDSKVPWLYRESTDLSRSCERYWDLRLLNSCRT